MYSKKIILDFDGTIFQLFVNYNLGETKIELAALLGNYGIQFDEKNDAFDSFFVVQNSISDIDLKKEILIKVNDIITAAEIDALKSGVVVNGFSKFVDYINANNIKLGIVSNNSKECIIKFLNNFYIKNIEIVGRDSFHPELMKPNTFVLNKICELYNCNKEDIFFVGDTENDFICARDFGVEFYGMGVNKDKKDKLLNLDKNLIIFNDFQDLLKYLERC